MKILHQPLSQIQVDSASRVYRALRQWRLADSTLAMLAVRCPGFSAQECLLKTVAVNSIYGTQLLATLRMADHIRGIFADASTPTADVSLVERMARLPAKQGEKPRLLISFASKFCHFFVNAETFPMYDEAARDALKLHLGDGYIVDGKQPYVAFCQNLSRLRELAKLNCKTKELDQYLWLTGMVMRWLKERTKKTQRISAELKAVLEHPSPEILADLQTMLPAELAMELDSPPQRVNTPPRERRDQLHFSIGGFFGEGLEVELQGGELRVRHARMARARNRETVVAPSPAAWSQFWQTVEAIGVWQWQPKYSNNDVLDGTQWSLELGHDGRSVTCEGSNAYPGANSPDYGRDSAFGRFLKALRALTGVKGIR